MNAGSAFDVNLPREHQHIPDVVNARHGNVAEQPPVAVRIKGFTKLLKTRKITIVGETPFTAQVMNVQIFGYASHPTAIVSVIFQSLDVVEELT